MRKITLLAGIALIYWSATSCFYEAPYWTPDGKKLLVGAFYQDEKVEDQYQFYLLDIESRKAHQLTDFKKPKGGIYPTLSPDGKRMAYCYYDSDQMKEGRMELWIMNIDGSGPKKVMDLVRQEEEMFHYTVQPWSPNSQLLVLQDFNPEKQIYQVILTDLEGHTKNLTGDTSSVLPSWSPDGEKIAYLELKDESYDLVMMSLKDSLRRPLVSGIPLPVEHRKELISFFVPSWSSDGKKIAYVQGEQIAVVDVQSQEKTILTQGPGLKVWPCWSPDGTRLSFMKVQFTKKEPLYGESLAEIWLVDSDGKNEKALTDLKGEAYLPRWSPTGDKIAFLFAQGNATAFLPGIVSLEGKIEFFPLNPFQKKGLALYYLGLNEEKAQKEGERLLKELISENPNTKWAGDAQDILDALHPEEEQRVKNST